MSRVAPLVETTPPFSGDALLFLCGKFGKRVLPIAGERLDIPSQSRLDVPEIRKPEPFVNATHLADGVGFECREAELVESLFGDQGALIEESLVGLSDLPEDAFVQAVEIPDAEG